MRFKIFAIFLLLIVCTTFVLPFASAETVTEGAAEFIFHEMHASFFSTAGDGSYYLDNDSGYFGTETYNLGAFNDLLFTPMGAVTYELSMNGSPFAVFSGDYAMFSPVNFTGGNIRFHPNQDSYFDGRLHSFALLFAVPTGFPYDVQDNFITFTNVDFYDDSSLTKLTVSVGTQVGDNVPVEISGSSSSTAIGDVPSFSYLSQMSVDADVVPLLTQFEFYILTWYHTPTFYNMWFNVIPTSLQDMFFVISLVDMVSVNTGYETGFREGVEVGKEQANNIVTESSASYSAGYDNGYELGEDAGYQTGYDDGIDYANTHVNQSSASYIQGKWDGIDSAGNYTFLSLVSAVIDAPIRAIFGYETVEDGLTVVHPGLLTFDVFGYDMSNFVLTIFSIAIVLAVLRIIRGL